MSLDATKRTKWNVRPAKIRAAGHSSSLIRVFAVRFKRSYGAKLAQWSIPTADAQPGPEVIKYLMLNPAEHEFFSAHKC